MADNEPDMVAAIDFGTMYSGYAFSVRDSFQKDPLSINLNQAWNAGGHQLLSLKTPTTILLDSSKQVVAFGYQAENRYTELVMDEKIKDYYYFHRFKMKLYENEGVSIDTDLQDIQGKSVLALDVFSLSLTFLKKHLLESLSRQGLKVKDEKIRWVLTVPSIWSDSAKHFMRQCAFKAGIPADNLVISLESEAASVFCQHLPLDKLVGSEKGLTTTKKGTQYMVVDIGGGTTDITALEHIGKNQLREICRSAGADCGGISVDEEFYQLFMKIVGKPVMDDVLEINPLAYIDLCRAFECVKRSLTPDQSGRVTVSIPFLTLTQMCEKNHDKDFVTLLSMSKYAHQISVVHDKLRIEAELLKSMFQSTTHKIVHLVKNALREIENKRSINVILVGGFAESLFVQSAIKSGIPSHRIIVPQEASLAVLKGAIIFGYKPDTIVSRVVRYTYGFQVSNDFDPKLHDIDRLVEEGGLKLCGRVFEKFIEINKTVSLGEKISETFTTTKKFQDLHYLPVYTSLKQHPHYTDELGCKHVGNVVVRIPNPTKKYRDVEVSICFGHTELEIDAVDVESGNKCETKFEFA